MVRVCIIKLTYYPQHMHVRRDAETLVNHGYEVDVICFKQKGQKSYEVVNGVNVYRVPGERHRRGFGRYLFEYTSFFFLVFLKLVQLSLKKKYDVVEVDTMPDFLVFTTLFPRLLGSKVILYMFENTAELFMSTFKKGPNHIGTRMVLFFEKISAGYAHRVISADGIPYKQVLESHGIPGDKITVVMNVPNEEVFRVRTPISKDNNGFRLITHGAILRRYGVQTLIKAIPLLIKEIPELSVDVVGDGEYRPEVEKLAHELGVEKYVRFTGFVPHDNIASLIAQANVGVAPMIDDVGLPNKLFEYFAMSKPAVVSSHPSLRATFGEDCVLYYQPGDEGELADRILELYNSPEKRASLVSHATVFYRDCHWATMQYVYLKVYEDLLS